MRACPAPCQRPSRRIATGLVIAFFCLLAMQGNTLQAAEVTLTAEEQAWLDAQAPIRLGPAPNFPPFEYFDTNGDYVGIAADISELMQQRLGVRFQIVQKSTWADMVEATRRHEIDFWMEAVATEERKEYLRFTKPYLLIPTLIYVRGKQQPEQTLDDFAGKQVVMVRSYASTAYVEKTYPKLKLHIVADIEQGLKLVSTGQADAMVIGQASADYYLHKAGISNLSSVGEAGYLSQLSLGTRKDWPLLHSILVKALASVTPAERRRAFRNWGSKDAEH